MELYLHVQHPYFVAQTTVPLFVPRRRLEARRTFEPAMGPWAIDSGGKELEHHGRWTIPAALYAARVERWARVIGRLEWASTLDWTCDSWVLARVYGLEHPGVDLSEAETPEQVYLHQLRTVASYLELRKLAPAVPWAPALHGANRDSYLEHVGMYLGAGVDLRVSKLVVFGSTGRRQDHPVVVDAAASLAAMGLRLHGAGLGPTGIRALSHLLVSADSSSWVYAAAHGPPLEGCPHDHCNNCLKYALAWREQMLSQPDPVAEF